MKMGATSGLAVLLIVLPLAAFASYQRDEEAQRRAPEGRGFRPAAKRPPTFPIIYFHGIGAAGLKPRPSEAGNSLFHQPARKTLRVSPNGPLRTIQQAIVIAAPGDTIRVEPGRYDGNLVLNKSLGLEGLGTPTIRGTGQASVITITADGCTVRGFVIEHSGGMLEEENSGVLLRSSGNKIERNELRDILFGIYLFRSNDNVLTDNVIHGRDSIEIGERGAGIHIWDSLRNTIIGNTIIAARDGMYLQNASNSVIRGNRISDLRYGLHYMYSNDNLFEGNTFDKNVAGAAIMYSRRIQFRRNLFIHNRGFSSFGILFQDDEDCVAEQNLIVDNGVGIFMETLHRSLFTQNLVAANDIAIETFSSAGENTFEANNFVENLSPLWVIGKHTSNSWNGERGNYWSGYDGYDLDGDGIGDVPFKIQNVFEHLEGNYPRLRLYLFSPAAQALALAEKVFPVVEGSREFDRYPLMKPVVLPIRMPEADPRTFSLSLLLPLTMIATSVLVIIRGTQRCSR
jgi:nitrous oxidase accessory protein